MQHITLTDDQLAAVANSHDPIAVHDRHGTLRGYISVVIADGELADARRALTSQEPRHTTAEVLAQLQTRSTS